MNSPDIQIAFRCSVCHEKRIENEYNFNRRREELGADVCRECNEQAEAAVIGLVKDSMPVGLDPYARNVIDFGVIEEYRPPVTRSNNWLGMFIAVVLVISAAVAVGRAWG